MEKQIDVNLNLITGIFYSQHTLDVEHDIIKDEVIESREYPNKYPANLSFREDYYERGEMHHTFYEDTNLYDKTALRLVPEIESVMEGMFGKGMFELDEIWGHIIYPGDQTMVHDHSSNIREPGLSFAYYPHVLEKGGNIHFLTEVNGRKCTCQHDIKKGDFLLFSKNIYHYTPRNASDEIRVTISGNFTPTIKFLDVLTNDSLGENPYWYYEGKP